tara:strand:- start:555 stop:1709 length:1155 start_codon:yes stop_codon:yes gene_type:complete
MSIPKSIKSWVRQSSGAKTAPDNAFSDQQALKLLQRVNETLNSLVELGKQGKSTRNLLEQRLALVQRRADINSKKLKKLHRENLRLIKRLDSVVAQTGARGLKGDARRLSIMMQAIQRALFLDPASLSYPYNLTARRFSLSSQNEEDGIIHAIFDTVGDGSRRFVEIGAGTNGGNSGFLASECGWSGMMLEANEDRLSKLKMHFEPLGITCLGNWVARENINDFIRDSGCEGEIDLLSIDIDGNDYWIWESITACSPRLVIIEYNSLFGPDRAVVVPYDAEFDRHRFVEAAEGGHYYFGASLQALSRLAEQKGYRLVVTEPRGVNAFFLRNDVGQEIPACDPSSAYRMLVKYGRRGHDLFEYISEHDLPLIDLDAGGGDTETLV